MVTVLRISKRQYSRPSKRSAAMSRILMFNVPGHGHVNPTLPVVRELVVRGEQVVYYLTDEFEPQIHRAGAVFRRIDRSQLGFGPPSGINFGGQADRSQMLQRITTFFPRMMADGLRQVPRLLDRARAEEADCV